MIFFEKNLDSKNVKMEYYVIRKVTQNQVMNFYEKNKINDSAPFCATFPIKWHL